MSERREGFYWVRRGENWVPARYYKKIDEWEMLEHGDGVQPDQIGPRIPSPDEAPPIGTRYRNEAGEVVAVVVPITPSQEMVERAADVPAMHSMGRCITLGGYLVLEYQAMLAALPEPD